MALGSDSASNRNEYQKYFLKVNAAGRDDNLVNFRCQMPRNSGSLKLLEI
jgi:hypothetical protein